MTKTEMTSRERVLTAGRRQTPDRVPRDIPLEKFMLNRMVEHYGTQDLLKAMRSDIAVVDLNPTRLNQDYSDYFSRPGVTWDEWGRGRIWDQNNQYAEYLFPLEHAVTIDEFIQYPWPDLDADYRYAGMATQIAIRHQQGYAVSCILTETIFETAWQLRGMTQLFEDFHQNDEKAEFLLNRIATYREAAARAFALAGADIIFLGDDVAMQTGLMISPRMYRQWFKPYLTRVIQAAKQANPDVLIKYHSDGMINKLVPDLLEAGIDILNPVQPECVDHAWIKETYGDQLAFCGGIGVQSVLPFGSPEEVREHVHAVIQTLGADGGLIIAPSHVIERDVSLDNIEAMLNAIDEFGNYD
jgi:uroporphyrinogen decarboxylase